MFEVCRQSQSNVGSLPQLAALAGALLLLILAYSAARMEIEPFWMISILVVILLIQLVIRQFPIFLMVGMIYVGTLKPRAAVGVSVTDPTLVTAGLLYAAVSLQVLLFVSGHAKQNLKHLFSGQMLGVSACCLLFFLIAISYTYSPAPEIGQQKALRLLAFDLPLVIIPMILLRNNRDVRQVLLLCMAGSLFLASRTVYRTLHPTTEMLLGQQDPTEIGEGLLMGIAALMALFYPFRERRWLHLFMIGSVILLTFGVIASVSRSAIFSFLLVGSISLFFLRRNLKIVSPKAILICVATTMIVAPMGVTFLWQLPATHAKVVEKVEELNSVVRGVPPPGTAGQRYSFAQSAWNAFLSKPFLGWGAGGWSTLWHLDDERVVTYPHDFVLEIAAEQGLAGLSIFTLVLLAMIRTGRIILKDPQNRFTFILPVLALNLLGNAVTGQVDDRTMWFFCGTFFALGRMAQQSTKIRHARLTHQRRALVPAAPLH